MKCMPAVKIIKCHMLDIHPEKAAQSANCALTTNVILLCLFYWFLEREEERDIDVLAKHQSFASPIPPTGKSNRQPLHALNQLSQGSGLCFFLFVPITHLSQQHNSRWTIGAPLNLFRGSFVYQTSSGTVHSSSPRLNVNCENEVTIQPSVSRVGEGR